MEEVKPELCPDDAIVAETLRQLALRGTPPPTGTYRLQFHQGFGFREAIAVVDYLAALGVSHIYASPLLQALPGTQHGYDVCDHAHFDTALGGDEGFSNFVRALHDAGLRLLMDIVPNHMAAHESNSWWRDVLENGTRSAYWDHFDIEPKPSRPELLNKILLPVLSAPYGQALESGALRAVHSDGEFSLVFDGRLLPLAPESAVVILSKNLESLDHALGQNNVHVIELRSIISSLSHLSSDNSQAPSAVIARDQEKEVIRRRLRKVERASAEIRRFVEANVAYYNDVANNDSVDAMDALLRAQSYRLSYWRTAADEINYRRFFDINELAAVCMERPAVFEASHRRVMTELVNGNLSGLRIDHIDGMFAPDEYLGRLQYALLARLIEQQIDCERECRSAATARLQPSNLAQILETVSQRLGLRPPTTSDMQACGIAVNVTEVDSSGHSGLAMAAAGPVFVLVEKILGADEPMPSNWPVAGTTGYDFVHDCDGLHLNPAGWQVLQRLYRRLTGDQRTFEQAAMECKSLILRMSMASELQMLAQRLDRIAQGRRHSRDFTFNTLRYALREILVCFPVYRIYPRAGIPSERDSRVVNLAVAAAKRRNPVVAPEVFDLISDLLLQAHPADAGPVEQQERSLFAGRFQQVTSPVTAKGVEDTAFYSHIPLVSVNEVGNDPSAPCVGVSAFHQNCALRRAAWPQTMLASTTHDSKRSEDVRARLHVLSEIPAAWHACVRRWRRWNRRLRRISPGTTEVSDTDEYLFYQTAIGIWPMTPPSETELQRIASRLTDYMEKATHEAKQVTSWINPNAEYDRAIAHFVAAALSVSTSQRFLADMQRFVGEVAPWGLYASLARLVLKMTCPGVPDLYQGQELWDFSLVDPDNRRPVDFEARRKMLEQVRQGDVAEMATQAALHPSDPRLKLITTQRLLTLRRSLPMLFAEGDYVPLAAAGPASDHVIAFVRELVVGDVRQSLLVVVPRLVLSRVVSAYVHSWPHMRWPWPDELWGDTTIDLTSIGSPVRCIFTQRIVPAEVAVKVSQCLQALPVFVGLTQNAAD